VPAALDTSAAIRGKAPTTAAGNVLSVNESYARPASPIGTQARASTRYLSPALLQSALDKLPAITSTQALCEQGRAHLRQELAKCDPSRPTVILLGDLHGTAADLGLAVTTMAEVPKSPRPTLLVEQTQLGYYGGFGHAEDLVPAFRRGRSSTDDVQRLMDTTGLSPANAVNICTWAAATALRLNVAPYDLDKDKPGATMEVREEPMVATLDQASQQPGSIAIGQVGIFHIRALHEALLKREDKPNVIAMAVVPEQLSFLQPSFTEQDVRRLSYLMATESILKLRQADSMLNDFPDSMALAGHKP